MAANDKAREFISMMAEPSTLEQIKEYVKKLKVLGLYYIVVPEPNSWMVNNKDSLIKLPQYMKPSQYIVRIVKAGSGGYVDYPKSMDIYVEPRFKEDDLVFTRVIAGSKVKLENGLILWFIHEDEILGKIMEVNNG